LPTEKNIQSIAQKGKKGRFFITGKLAGYEYLIDSLKKEIKFLLPVKLSPPQATGYYARPHTVRDANRTQKLLYADSPQAAGN